MIASIETSGNNCSVAIHQDNIVLSSINVNKKNIHDSLLAQIYNDALNNISISNNQIQAISINIGPGSFTGLRIGLSFAKGLVFGSEIKIIPLIAHDIVYTHFKQDFYKNNFNEIIVILSAYKTALSYKIFDLNTNNSTEISHIEISEINGIVNPDNLIITDSLELATKSNNSIFFNNFSAEFQTKLAANMFKNSIFVNNENITPIYFGDKSF